MLVRDVMTSNVITIPSDTPVLEAERILAFHKFERLPIVDKGKLVGLVTKDDLLKAEPSSATSLSRGELLYLLSKLTVKEIMKKNVVTVPPDIPVELATAIAQKNRVGCLPVVEGDRVVGILTTNDIFYKILNPLFGIGETGKRIIIYEGGERDKMQKVLESINKLDLKIKTFWTIKSPDTDKNDLIVHLDAEDISQLISELKELGFSVEEREFIP
ncbi:MAG: acetoin dehydrogenase [Deltaproteobacteria bacterium]|nr:MAG: acetoin dehydrogenase [Deltaproteobacteria bacterium]